MERSAVSPWSFSGAGVGEEFFTRLKAAVRGSLGSSVGYDRKIYSFEPPSLLSLQGYAIGITPSLTHGWRYL
jgi:hypothetical protein